MSGSDLCIPRNETAPPCYFQNRNIIFFLTIPSFMYFWAINIFLGSVCLFFFFCSHIGKPILGIYKLLTDTWMKELRKRAHTVSFLGIHKSVFRYSVLCWSHLADCGWDLAGVSQMPHATVSADFTAFVAHCSMSSGLPCTCFHIANGLVYICTSIHKLSRLTHLFD